MMSDKMYKEPILSHTPYSFKDLARQICQMKDREKARTFYLRNTQISLDGMIYRKKILELRGYDTSPKPLVKGRYIRLN